MTLKQLIFGFNSIFPHKGSRRIEERKLHALITSLTIYEELTTLIKPLQRIQIA